MDNKLKGGVEGERVEPYIVLKKNDNIIYKVIGGGGGVSWKISLERIKNKIKTYKNKK